MESPKAPLLNFFLKKPVLCVFEATTKCNSLCPMCSIRERASGKEMSLEQIKCVFQKLKKAGICWVYVQGGEPLLRPQIKEILLFLKKNFEARLITNGLLLSEDFQEFLVKNRIGITISVDTLRKDRYRKIRGINAWGKLFSNIRLLREKNYGNVSLHCTVSRLNIDEVFDIRAFALENGFFFSALPYISGIGIAGKEAEGLKPGNPELSSVFERLAELEKNEDYIASLVYSDVLAYLKGANIGPCDALSYSVYLTQEGLISPCLEKPPFLDLTKEGAFLQEDERQKQIVKACYSGTPCYYGCTRSVHALRKNLLPMLMHPFSSGKTIRAQLKLRKNQK
jgi:MoaA/NifB/PqqE/SkfB family radical SAM enzyme